MALPLETRLLASPGAVRLLSDLKPGDQVYGACGSPLTVVALSETLSAEVYEVEFRDGLVLRTSGSHLWHVQSSDRKSRRQSPRFLCLDAIAGRVRDSAGGSRHQVQLTAPVEFAPIDLPVNPYVLGALLGDGGISSKQVYFATADIEMVERIAPLLPPGIVPRRRAAYWWNFAAAGPGMRNPLVNALRDLELMGRRAETKFIPAPYKRAGTSQRIALMQGLLDTDGSASTTKPVVFASTSAQLASDLREVVHSLGGISKARRGPGTKLPLNWLSITVPDGVDPFALIRKADLYKIKLRRPRHLLRAILSVTPVGRELCRELVVSGDGFFLAEDFLVIADNRSERRCSPSKYSPRHRHCSHELR